MTTREFTIGQLAKASETKAETIRYYERESLLQVPRRNGSGYRIFGEADLKRLLFIRRGRGLGFSVDSIRELLELSDQADEPCEGVDATVAQHLEQVRERLDQLRTLENELIRLNNCCKGGRAIRDCRIIETLSGSNEDSPLD